MQIEPIKKNFLLLTKAIHEAFLIVGPDENNTNDDEDAGYDIKQENRVGCCVRHMIMQTKKIL